MRPDGGPGLAAGAEGRRRPRGESGPGSQMVREPEDIQERLINWGYAVCDAALRKHYDGQIAKPQGFPYPGRGV